VREKRGGERREKKMNKKRKRKRSRRSGSRKRRKRKGVNVKAIGEWLGNQGSPSLFFFFSSLVTLTFVTCYI
jgi:hypothetical protein